MVKTGELSHIMEQTRLASFRHQSQGPSRRFAESDEYYVNQIKRSCAVCTIYAAAYVSSLVEPDAREAFNEVRPLILYLEPAHMTAIGIAIS